MKNLKMVGVIAMILVMVTTLTAGAASWPNPGPGSADVTVMNIGTAAASVTAEYYDLNGSVAATKTRSSLAVNGTHDFLASASGLPDGWQGSMVLSSTDNVASVATVKWAGGVDAGDDGDRGQYIGVTAGATTVYCPALYQLDGALYATLSIQNTGASDAAVQINFRDRNGVAYPSNPVAKTIKVNSQTTLDLSTSAAYFASKDGSAVITSNQPVAAVVAIHWAGRSSTYGCPTQGNTKLYVPAQFRLTTGGTTANDFTMYSANVLMNLTGNTANTMFHYIPRNPANASLDVPVQIPPYSAKGLNTFNGGSMPASTFDTLGTNWDGVVVIDSDQPLAGINNTIWGINAGNKAATFIVVGPTDGSTAVYLPYQRRISPSGDWQEWSAAIVQNLSGSTANVTLKYYDANGAEVLTLTQAIDSGKAFGFNTRTGGSRPAADFNPLGTNYAGGLRITSDQNIAVVAQVITASVSRNTASAYNGVKP